MGVIYPQITPLAPLPAHRAYRPVGRSLRLGEQITQIFRLKVQRQEAMKLKTKGALV